MKKNELVQIIEGSQVEQKTQTTLMENFSPLFDEAVKWKEEAQSIIVTNLKQTDLMQRAREIRLNLRQIRVNADKTRKNLKEDALRYGKAVQGVYNVIEYLIKPLENHLEDQEKYGERLIEKQREEVKAKRWAELEPLAEYIPVSIDLSDMTEDDYQKLLRGAQIQQKQREDAERQAEQERIEREKKEAEEREAVRLENERLKKEREEFEKAIEAERKEREKKEAEDRKAREAEEKARLAKEKKEREEIDRLEAEKKALEDAEKKRIADEKAKKEADELARIEAERKANSAPDIEKMKNFADVIISLKSPACTTKEAHKIVTDVMYKLSDIANKLTAEANKLK